MREQSDLSFLWSVWGGTIRRIVLTLTLAALGMFAALSLLEIPFAPWIRSFGLWPTLTGDWHGTLETPDGRTSFIHLELSGEVFSFSGTRGPRRASISGTARWCDEGGRIREFRISGAPDNWRGTQFHLSMLEEVERDSGVTLGDLRGEWSGDEIRASGPLVSLARTATAEATRSAPRAGPPPAARYALRRADGQDLRATCVPKR
jgi:hypothetical protein